MPGHRRGGHRRGGQRNKKDDAMLHGEDGQQRPQAARGGGGSHASSSIKPDLQEILLSVESLYADELKAFGRILRKRIGERTICCDRVASLYQTPHGMNPLPDIDVDHLLSVCEACDTLIVEPEEGGDWSVTIVGRPSTFVDIYSPEDCYAPNFWAAAEAYFASLSGDDMCLPGGRYACAQALLSRNLDFFGECSLGQVCHIVQLAISKRKILGYSSGAVVPYGHSQSRLKEQCAEQQQPIGPPSGGGAGPEEAVAFPHATWDVARACMKEIFEDVAEVGKEGSSATVPLSNIKRLFRSRFNLELSETALGHSKLSDLLQDRRFSSVCSVQLEKHGYIVVQKTECDCVPEASDDDAPTRSLSGNTPSCSDQDGVTTISLADSLFLSLGLQQPEIHEGIEEQSWSFCPNEPLCLEHALPFAPLPSLTPLPSPGVPPSTTVRKWSDPSRCVEFCQDEPLCFDDVWGCADITPSSGIPQPTPLPSPGVPTSTTVRKWADQPRGSEFFPQEPLRFENPAYLAAPWVDGLAEGHYISLPTGVCPPLPLQMQLDASEPRRVEFCPDEPLCLEGLCIHEPMEVVPSLALSPMPTPLASPGDPTNTALNRWQVEPRRLSFCMDESVSSPTPSRAVDKYSEPLKSFVQNTFIHAKLPPPTPPPGAKRRARSVPKDVGLYSYDGVDSTTDGSSTACPGATPLSPSPLGSLSPRIIRDSETHTADEIGASPAPFCVTEPLPLEDLCSFADIAERQPCQFPSLSPSVLPRGGLTGLMVQNTFIHTVVPPLTPAPVSVVRSRSVPPETGSARSAATTRHELSFLPRPYKCADACYLTPSSGRRASRGIEGVPAFVPVSFAISGLHTDQQALRLADHI